jgi:hypothetical protein
MFKMRVDCTKAPPMYFEKHLQKTKDYFPKTIVGKVEHIISYSKPFLYIQEQPLGNRSQPGL